VLSAWATRNAASDTRWRKTAAGSTSTYRSAAWNVMLAPVQADANSATGSGLGRWSNAEMRNSASIPDGSIPGAASPPSCEALLSTATRSIFAPSSCLARDHDTSTVRWCNKIAVHTAQARFRADRIFSCNMSTLRVWSEYCCQVGGSIRHDIHSVGRCARFRQSAHKLHNRCACAVGGFAASDDAQSAVDIASRFVRSVKSATDSSVHVAIHPTDHSECLRRRTRRAV